MLSREPSMAKTLSWFDRVKRFCSCDKKPKAEKQTRKWRTWVAGKLKYKQCPALLTPQRAVNEAKENQKKYALTVAMATAAAAEAAVAAVQAAAEVVRLTAASHSHHSLSNIRQVLAATNIQSAFRGYLARKALRALKGVVRLQAVVRGQAVRRQMAVNMKNVQDLDRTCNDGDNDLVFKSKEFKEEGVELEHVGQRSWDYSILTKEAIEALWSRKQEAAIKRKRMMKYSLSHRERSTKILHGPLPKMEYGRTLNFIEQWADKEAGHRGVKNLKPIASSNTLGTTDASYGPMQFKLRSIIDGLSSPASCSRRSFACRRESIGGHDTSVPNSPSYMAATQSTMAKTRSMSTPRQRIGHRHSCFDHSLAYEDGMSYYHSSDAELLSSSRRGGHCPVKLLA